MDIHNLIIAIIMIALTKIVASFKQNGVLQLNMMMARTVKPTKQVGNTIATKLR